jgi:hypothetical protein
MNYKTLKKGFLMALILFSTSFIVNGQNAISNPYSLFGTGKSVNRSFYQHSSMGGVGVGLRNPNHYSLKNPASITGIEFTVFDAGMNMSNVTLSDGTNNATDRGSNFGYFTLAFPVPSKNSNGFAERINLATAFGLNEYAQYGFNFKTPLNQDDFQVNSYQIINGIGGLNRVFFGLAANPLKFMSVGINYSRVFGSYNNRVLLVFPENKEIFSSNEENFRHNSANVFDLGVQFFKQFNKIQHTLGLTYTLSSQMNQDGYRYMESFDGVEYATGRLNVYDTILFEDVVGSNKLPTKYGIGYSLSTKNFGLYIDYEQVNYKEIQTSFNYLVRDERNLAFGMSFVPSTDYNNKGDFLKKIEYRAGIYQTQHHFNVNNQFIDEFGISFGLGLPVIRSSRGNQNTPQISRVNIGIEYSQMGKAADGLFSENLLRLTLGLNLNDKWFIKRKYL